MDKKKPVWPFGPLFSFPPFDIETDGEGAIRIEGKRSKYPYTLAIDLARDPSKPDKIREVNGRRFFELPSDQLTGARADRVLVDDKPTLETGVPYANFEDLEIYHNMLNDEYKALDRAAQFREKDMRNRARNRHRKSFRKLKSNEPSTVTKGDSAHHNFLFSEGMEKVKKNDPRWAAGEPIVVTGPAKETWPFTPTARRKATPAFVPISAHDWSKSGPFDRLYPWQKATIEKMREVNYAPIEERILAQLKTGKTCARKDMYKTPPIDRLVTQPKDAMFPERFSKKELDAIKASPSDWWRKQFQQEQITINTDAIDALAKYGKEDNRLYNILSNATLGNNPLMFIENDYWLPQNDRARAVINRIFEKRKQAPTMETILSRLEALHQQAVELEDVLKKGQDIEAASMGFLAGGIMACFGPVEFDGKKYDDFDLQHFVSGKARLYGVLEKHPNIYEDVRILDKDAIQIYRNFADFLDVALPSLSILESKTEDGKFVTVLRYRPFNKNGELLPTGNGTSRYRYVSILLASLRILIWAFRDKQISMKRLIRLGANILP